MGSVTPTDTKAFTEEAQKNAEAGDTTTVTKTATTETTETTEAGNGDDAESDTGTAGETEGE